MAAYRIHTKGDSLMVDDVDGDFLSCIDLLDTIRKGWWTGETLYVWRERPTGALQRFSALINPDHIIAVHDLR